MTRAQFLNDLYRRLAGNGMDADQAEQHLTYYAEMLADRMEEGMSEDQAVSSMEDVGTIARRILEEEGLPCRPLEEMITPPSYPDVSKLGGGGKRAYQAPRRGRKLAQIGLWALAAVIALGAASRWLWMRNVMGYTHGAPVDYATSSAPVEEVPALEATYADWYEAWDIPYMYGYEYSGGMTTYTGSYVGKFDKLDIQWAAGTVYIQSWTGEDIQIQEYAHSDLNGQNARNAMAVEVEDGTLSIRYRSGTSLGSVKGDKWLAILVPDGMLEELEIETTSADVQLIGLEQGELDVSAASGCIYLTECYVRKAELETISGEVYLSGVYAEELDVSTTSGYVSGDAHCVDVEVETVSGGINLYTAENTEKIKISTTSGDIWCSVENPAIRSIGVSATSGDSCLSLPYNMGFTLDYSTVSGDMSSSFDISKQNGKYTYNGGGCEIKVNTVSGSLDIY